MHVSAFNAAHARFAAGKPGMNRKKKDATPNPAYEAALKIPLDQVRDLVGYYNDKDAEMARLVLAHFVRYPKNPPDKCPDDGLLNTLASHFSGFVPAERFFAEIGTNERAVKAFARLARSAATAAKA